jgi:hypothetical protein
MMMLSVVFDSIAVAKSACDSDDSRGAVGVVSL